MSDKYAMSKFMNSAQRVAAINADVEALTKKRDHAADKLGKPLLAWTYQMEIDKLIGLLK